MELRQCASDEGVGEAVLFAGYCSDLPRVYHSMDVLVLPSFVEGMPMVVLEAMAAGKPVIATRVGAIPKLITPGQEGMLVEPGNTDALVEALSCLLSNAEMQRSMGQRGQALVHQNYSATVMAKRYLEFYSQAVPLMRIQPECAAQCLEDRVDVG
jgi:glycosyltransferase involved in cell wall biosynthesis